MAQPETAGGQGTCIPRTQSGPSKAPVCQSGRSISGYAAKNGTVYTLFPGTPFLHDLRQTGQFPLSYKTLMYANGRQNSGRLVG